MIKDLQVCTSYLFGVLREFKIAGHIILKIPVITCLRVGIENWDKEKFRIKSNNFFLFLINATRKGRIFFSSMEMMPPSIRTHFFSFVEKTPQLPTPCACKKYHGKKNDFLLSKVSQS